MFAIPDVDSGRAVLADGSVWIATGSAVPSAVRALTEPVPCRLAEPTAVTGTLRGIDAQVGADCRVTAPYTVDLAVDSGPELGLDRLPSVKLDSVKLDSVKLDSVKLAVRVTAETVDGTDPALLRAALSEAAPVSVSLRCQGSGLVATPLARA